jgi:hypothetical protein
VVVPGGGLRAAQALLGQRSVAAPSSPVIADAFQRPPTTILI